MSVKVTPDYGYDWDEVSRRLRGEDMATAVKEDAPKIGLVAKLAEVMGLMRNVPKEGFNRAQSYRYVKEDDVARMASGLLAERKVWIHQTVLETSAVDLYKTNSGLNMRMTIARMAFRFIDGETGEATETQEFVGTGADTGDKGIYKAMTGAEKYFLMKSFLISTGDDPESDEKVDKAAAASEAAIGPKATTVKQADHGTVRRGGKSAGATDAQLAELKRMAKELGITSQADLGALVKRVLVANGAGEQVDVSDLVSFLRSMTSADMGALLVGVQALVDEATDEPDEEPDDAVTEVKDSADDDVLELD